MFNEVDSKFFNHLILLKHIPASPHVVRPHVEIHTGWLGHGNAWNCFFSEASQYLYKILR